MQAHLLGAVLALDGGGHLLLLFLGCLPEHRVYALAILTSGVPPLDVLVGCLVQMLQET